MSLLLLLILVDWQLGLLVLYLGLLVPDLCGLLCCAMILLDCRCLALCCYLVLLFSLLLGFVSCVAVCVLLLSCVVVIVIVYLIIV